MASKSDIKKIFDNLANNDKIEEGMTEEQVVNLIVKDYKKKFNKKLTDSQKKEIKQYLNRYIIKRTFDENKEDFGNTDELIDTFVINNIIDKKNKQEDRKSTRLNSSHPSI